MAHWLDDLDKPGWQNGLGLPGKERSRLPVSEKLRRAYLNPVIGVGFNVPKGCIFESSRDQFADKSQLVDFVAALRAE